MRGIGQEARYRMNSNRLEGQNAIVTGASSGLGHPASNAASIPAAIDIVAFCSRMGLCLRARTRIARQFGGEFRAHS